MHLNGYGLKSVDCKFIHILKGSRGPKRGRGNCSQGSKTSRTDRDDENSPFKTPPQQIKKIKNKKIYSDSD